ncbi:MAG: hypothetical protein KDB45_04495 [Mycobacterium sp.]|nr:hypothetical protein [Mycobacterium sp.]
MTAIAINPFTTDAASDSLWHHYDGQQAAQPVYLSLDLRDGEWTADYDGTVGPGATFAIHYGLVRIYSLPAIPTVEAANRLLADLAPLAQQVYDHSTITVDYRTGNEVGGVDDAGREAEERIIEALAEFGGDDADIVSEWSIDVIDSGGYGVAADSTDEQIAAIANEILSDLAANNGGAVAVCPGLVHYLTGIRDELAGGRAGGDD